MRYQVFIDGPVDASPAGASALVKKVASHFGAPEETLRGHMASGRFRVKADVELAAARTLAKTLAELGAHISIVDPGGEIVERMGHEPAAEATSVPDALPMEQDFDALTNPGLAQLSGVDGRSFESESDKPKQNASVPLDSDDAFLPPKPEGPSELFLEEAAIEVSTPKPSRPEVADEPLAATPQAPLTDPVDSSRAGTKAHTQPEAEMPSRRESAPPKPRAKAGGPPKILLQMAQNTRLRNWLGTFIILLVGFVPIHFIASSREDAAYETVRKQVDAEQGAISYAQEWESLDVYRESKKKEMQVTRRNIAITSFVLWALLSGLLAFLLFRKIPWDAIARAGREREKRNSAEQIA